MTFTLLQPFKESIPLFKFEFGTTAVYATTWKSPITWGGNVYRPEPASEAKLPKRSGSVKEEACRVELPTTRSLVHPQLSSLAAMLSSPRAVPGMRVTVMNLLRSGSEHKMLYLFEGKLTRITRNPDGKKSIVRIELQPELGRGLADISLGRRCDPECDAVFGKAGCWVDNSLFFNAANGSWAPAPSTLHINKVRRVIALCSFVPSVNSRQISLLLDTTAPEHSGLGGVQAQLCITQQLSDWWVRSFLEKDGLRIPIQAWKQGTALFTLNRVPPLSWDGARVMLVPDCPRTSAACAQRGNTANFNGLGIGMPTYNPTLEEP